MEKTAILYRMVTDKHICPFGLKSRELLKRKGFNVEDHHLKTRDEIDVFKAQHDVKTTPQTFIDGARIGGYDDLVQYFGVKTLKQEGLTYQPVIAVFAVTFLMALASTFAMTGGLALGMLIKMFVAYSMCVLAILKLRDLYSFSNQFITYDLLAMRWIRYAYIYPFAEAFVGIGMIAGALTLPVACVALFIGGVGALSVFKAVYMDKRDLKCACVGGNSNVPLGFISLTENLMMVAMGFWMLLGIL
jgi:glutaredoxin